VIEDARVRAQAQEVLVAVEPTGCYFENIACHLLESNYGMTPLNSFAVKQNIARRMMQQEKTDKIDVVAIGDVVYRGEGHFPVVNYHLRIDC
jgi:hypothetical protein